jgi:hypothetical protein
MRIISVSNDCFITSIYGSMSSTYERIVVLGQKLKVPVHKYAENNNFMVTPRVEIVNLDGKTLPLKRVLDHSYYINSNSFIYDAIVPNRSDICYTIVKDNGLHETVTKIFIWEYATITLVRVLEFEHHIEEIIPHDSDDSVIIMSYFYVGLWEYNQMKKKLVLKKEYENEKEILNACFWSSGDMSGICIVYKDKLIKIFDKNHEVFKIIDSGFFQFISNPTSDVYVDAENPEITGIRLPKDYECKINVNFNIVKPIVRFKNDYFIFFLANSNTYITFKLIDQNLNFISMYNIDLKISDHAYIQLNVRMTQMIIVMAKQASQFKDNFNKAKKSLFQYKGDRNAKQIGDTGYKKIDKTSTIHQLEKANLTYFSFSINLTKDDLVLNPQPELFKYSSIGQHITTLSCSIDPRYVIASYFSKELLIFKQNSIDVTTNKDTTETSEPMALGIDTFCYKQLDKKPVSISVSPYGNNVFISYEETSNLYSILENEISDRYKINSFCKACSYSTTGKYLAISYSEIKTDYNIIIINADTMSVEYLITNLPPANRFLWADDDKILVAQLDDNNIFGWRLDSKRLLNYVKNKDSRSKKDSNLVFKIADYGEKICDFAFDHILNYLVILSVDKLVKFFQTTSEDESWEMLPDCRYCSVTLARFLDIIIFGTSEGAIRICIWPISNFTKKELIDHPPYTEKFLHSAEVTHLVISTDYKLLYSASVDGSIYISTLNFYHNETLVNLSSLSYYNTKNIPNRKFFLKMCDFVKLTENDYKDKLKQIYNLESAISKEQTDAKNELDKLRGEYHKLREDKTEERDKQLNQERKKLKEIEEQKENITKILRDQNIFMSKKYEDELTELKNKYVTEKHHKQEMTKNLTSMLNENQNDFENIVIDLERRIKDQHNFFKFTFDKLLHSMKDKSRHLDDVIDRVERTFETKVSDIENKYEDEIHKLEHHDKSEKDLHFKKMKELKYIIEKLEAENRNTEDKIEEWEKNLVELKQNNTDLMENYLFNTLKEKQMSNYLKKNEELISDKETEIKTKRDNNDKLEQLRHVLEHQIKNLIKEKTPIEDQIKNFENLHKEFQKTFNLLYDEQINIDDFTESNVVLIEKFKKELAKKNNRLYIMKNIFKKIELKMNSIFTIRIDNKTKIIEVLQEIITEWLENYKENNVKPESTIEAMLQERIMGREINRQKNTVLTDLLTKRKQIKKVQEQKYELLSDVQIENSELIEECANIRNSLEEILKYITDIEKKFIELTNSHIYLQKMESTLDIKKGIKQAKQNIELGDIDYKKLSKPGKLDKSKFF